MKRINKQGVSLIVLVITIIVMIILAGTIILSLNNNGIIGKAQEAVNKTNLAEVQNLAQLAWAEAYLNNERTDEKLKAAVEAALAAQEITEADYLGYTMEVTTSGVKFVKADQGNSNQAGNSALNHSGIIPEGGTYIRGLEKDENGEYWDWEAESIVTYSAGQAFPTDVQPGDVYRYNDFTYMYSASYDVAYEQLEIVANQNGWGVVCYSSEAAPGLLLESINNQPLVNMHRTFQGSHELVTVPTIPASVTNMVDMLVDCENVTGEIEINANPTYYADCFAGTTLPIVLTGSSTILEELAATGNGNVTVKEQ